MPTLATADAVALVLPPAPGVLTPAALQFVADLERLFGPRRRALLDARKRRARQYEADGGPDFLPETRHIRDGAWRIAPVPPPLQDRRVEITGPVDRKMMIHALNSGAKVFMADFEDSLSPTWDNVVKGHRNVIDAVQGTLTFEHPEKGEYTVGPDPAVLVLRPRGWHLDEPRVQVGGRAMSASLFDFGISVFHNARAQVDAGLGPYYYLPKLEHHDEARLWDDVFRHAEAALGLAGGTIKATVLIETLPAAFQMDEILYALRDHVVGLNAGRWDYIFSCMKTLPRHTPPLPDRSQVSMTVPHMRAYTELLVKTCHKRGAFAMGGMSAFIPDRNDPQRTEAALAQVRADKQREAGDGCDGTWVAHPGLVPIAMEVFDAVLAKAPNQLHRPRGDVTVGRAELLDFKVPGGQVTAAGVAQNIDVGLRYLTAWLSGNGAAAIHGLMEDAATAEISRSQLWQWLHTGTPVDGAPLSADGLRQAIHEHAATLPGLPHIDVARDLLTDIVLADDFLPFLTVAAMPHLEPA